MTDSVLTPEQEDKVVHEISMSEIKVQLASSSLESIAVKKRTARRNNGSQKEMDEISFERAYQDALRQCYVQHGANLEEILDFGKDSIIKLIQEYSERLSDADKLLKKETSWEKDRKRYAAQVTFYSSAIEQLNKLLNSW
ncbi:hypothetical protein C4G84_RS23165 [Vibrio parahaemolyticus O5:K30]|uniref:hypothetical protein n=1 Tax=Vibrio vulnificus TaxID=672 RepID=UPI003D9C939B|nr:hypothetical protein [Vibrio parahaemolyticus O5:K30]